MGELSAKLTERAFHGERRICPLTRYRGSSPEGRALRVPHDAFSTDFTVPKPPVSTVILSEGLCPQSKDLRAIENHM